MRSATLGIALGLTLLGGGSCTAPVLIGLPDADGALVVGVVLSDLLDGEGARVRLDGRDVSSLFRAEGPGLRAALPLPPPGAHGLEVRVTLRRDTWLGRLFPRLRVPLQARFETPAATPPLLAAEPERGAVDLPRTAWLRFAFRSPPAAAALIDWGFALECDGARIARAAHRIGDAVILDPTPELPPGSRCRAIWRGADARVVEHAFSVAADAPGEPASVAYDRTDPTRMDPLPDDFWLVADPTTVSGRRLVVDAQPLGLVGLVTSALSTAVDDRDGFSPVQPAAIVLSDPPDPQSLPADAAAALDPFAAIGLYDMDPASPEFGRRVPFVLRVRREAAPDGSFDNVLLLFPSRSLREGGRYGLVLSRRLFADTEPGRPFGRSAFFEAVSSAAVSGEPEATSRARESVAAVLDFLERVPEVPVAREDVALALRFSVRSLAFDPSDLVAIKEAALAAAPPELDIRFSGGPSASRAFVAVGSIELPFYLESDDLGVIHRDPVTGRPTPNGFEPVEFVLTLPKQAQSGRVPIVMLQHGSPGRPIQVIEDFNEFLDDAGFAVAGIQDFANRRFGETRSGQLQASFVHLLNRRKLPLTTVQTVADMIGFLRAIQGLADVSLLPVGAPDAIPEIDASRILYYGGSAGGTHGEAFLPFAPEITAAVAFVGGGRSVEVLLNSDAGERFLDPLFALLPGAAPREVLTALVLSQNEFDRQDPTYLGRHLYRQPLVFQGLADREPPSLLWVEGLGDTITPFSVARAAALELGLPHVRPVLEGWPGLDPVDAPLRGNLALGRTAGHFQFDPFETPSCVESMAFDGHQCPFVALEAHAQALHFLRTALGGEAEIIDPLR